MAPRVEQERRGMKLLLAVLAPFRKPLVIAALCGFLAGVAAFWGARGMYGCGWRPLGGGDVFSYDEVMAARRNARYASQSLSSFLGDGKRGDDWRQYLRLDELQAELGDGDYLPPPSKRDPGLIRDVVARLSENYPGLELQQFAGLRSALSAYSKMLGMSDPAPSRPAPPEARTATTPQPRYR